MWPEPDWIAWAKRAPWTAAVCRALRKQSANDSTEGDAATVLLERRQFAESLTEPGALRYLADQAPLDVAARARFYRYRGHTANCHAANRNGQNAATSRKSARTIRPFSIYPTVTGFGIGVRIGNAGVGRSRLMLRRFPSRSRARKYLLEPRNLEQLRAEWQQWRNIPCSRPEPDGNAFPLRETILPDRFGRTFRPTGVQFGTAMTQAERQTALNRAHAAFIALSEVLGIAPELIFLRRRLGLSFGVRGNRSLAGAHFSMQPAVIALTRRKGWGSMAHEWFHALDFWFGHRAAGPHAPIRPITAWPKADIPDRDCRAVKAALAESEFYGRAFHLDRRCAEPYWSQWEEMGARAFESVVYWQLRRWGLRNDWLVCFSSAEEWRARDKDGDLSYPFLSEAEASAMQEPLLAMVRRMASSGD